MQAVGDPGDYIDIKAEPMRATMTILGTVVISKHTLTREDVAKKLTGLAVTHGIDWVAVDRVLAGKKFGSGYVIANGTVPTASQDASIEEKIKIDPDIHPVMDKSGKVDYKNVDNIHQVKKGEVISVKTPAKAGEPGFDIYGKAIPAVVPKDIQFKVGINTEISPDGLQLLASTGGYVYHQTGMVCVGVIYVHKGNVDFKTGNLHYQGDIQVQGNVDTGFIVEAQGNVLIEGTVDAADVISHTGDVSIKSSVFGHNKGRILAKGNITLSAAQDVVIECENGTLTVEKGLRNCAVRAQTLKANAPGCSIVGGEIKSFGDVSIGSLGGEGCITEIRILDKDEEAMKDRLIKIDKTAAEVAPKIAMVETRLKGMKAMAAKFGGTLSDRSKADLKLVLDQYAGLKTVEKSLEAEKAKLAELRKLTPKNQGKFSATEKILSATLVLFGHTKVLEPEDVKKEWIWTPEGLVGRMLMTEAPAKPGTASAKPA